MNFQDFQRQFNTGKRASTYVFHGDEQFFVDQGLSAITQKYVTAASASFNRDVFYGDDADPAQILNAALSIPMMSEMRVVVVKNFQRLSQSGKERILRYCARPSPHCILVLVAKNIDQRKKVYAGLKKNAVFVDCKPPYENQVLPLIMQYVRDQNGRIAIGAIRMLQARLGNSIKGLTSEIDKLMGYLPAGSEITEAVVEETVGISRNYNVFELRDAIGGRRLDESLKILGQMIEMGESAVFMITSLTGFFMQIWRLKELRKASLPRNEMAKRLGIHPYFLDKAIAHAMSFTDEEIIRNLQRLLEADIHLKTSFQKPRIVIELLVVQLLDGKRAVA